jgi:hypothetical protein
LDVDDDIWQDVGLDDEEDSVPAWLGDEDTRRGIKALLELDRCFEEEECLGRERCALQEWFIEEWKTVLMALRSTADDADVQYQLHLRKRFLCYLYFLGAKNQAFTTRT